MKHLAIFTEETIRDIFRGEKTIDVRFSLKRIPPFKKVESGDLIYVKKSGGKIVGQFKVKRVVFFDNLSAALFNKIRRDYQREIKADRYFWHNHAEAKYGTLIFISEVQGVLFPIQIEKRDRRPWVVLDTLKIKN